MTIRCANCGQEHYTRPIVDADEGVMVWQWRAVRIQGYVQLRMLRFLVEKMDATVLMKEIIEAVWPDPDGEPEYVENTINVTMHRSRRRLARLGLEIVTIRGGGGFYLRPIPPVASPQSVARSECLESA